MIKFFRKIRKQFLSENKFSKYLIYAFGEIILVVIGILIALQINNWNEEKKQNKAFLTSIEQIYTHLHSAINVEEWDIDRTREQLVICEKLQNKLDSFTNFEILKYIHYLDWIPGTGFRLLNYNDHLNQIEYDANDKEKSSLVFHLNQFFILQLDALDHDYTNVKEKYFEPIFKKNNLPLSSGQVKVGIRNSKRKDISILNDYAINKINEIKTTEEFRAALISTEERLRKIIYFLEYRQKGNKATRKMLLQFEPKLKLRYDKLIIIGTALTNGDELPMNLTDEQMGSWMITTKLKEGTIEFKSLYADYFSWGTDTNTKNSLKIWGQPINVKSGNYEIIINLEKMTYTIKEK